MPNHWESSARPLFVKTVFVNGNRHAVLFEKDPLLRCGNSAFKKTSRPNSSISFSSELSITSSESEESKDINRRQRQSRDLSTELQSCLVKLKLTSANKGREREVKCLCSPKEVERSQDRGCPRQKRQKCTRERKKRCEEPDACKLSVTKNSCYVYNLENYKGKRNYCFVKISSQSPKLILNCCCDNSKTCEQANKNVVISATIHNLVMTPQGNVFPFENAEVYWNNYVTSSYYNSLSEKVLQWLDMARRRKAQKEKGNSTPEDDSTKFTERIFSGKAFAEEIKKTESANRSENRIIVNAERAPRNDEDVESEVTGEANVETLLSKDLPGGCNSENSSIKSYSQTVTSTSGRSDSSRSAKTSLKIQDLLLNYNSNENHNKRKTRNHKFKEKDRGESEDFIITTLNTRAGGVSKKGVFVDKFDKEPRCRCNRMLDECEDKIKNQILTESFPETNQKSINNLNNTRGRPVLIQNLLSPQQPEQMSYLQEEKIVWASERNKGRPQLHIFIPSVILKDQNDDSMSECDNYLNV